MNSKKFTGKNMSEIMAQVKAEFGEDAMIIQSKKVKKDGIFGFFGKEYIEVIAAVETEKRKNEKERRTALTEAAKVQDEMRTMKRDWQEANFKNKMEDSLKKQRENSNLNVELEEIKSAVHQLNTRFSKMFRDEDEERLESKKKDVIGRLVAIGISENLSSTLVEETLKNKAHLNKQSIIETIHEKFGAICLPKERSNLTQGYHIFVGSTGVGKTTTLAKMASNLAIQENKKIGFLTLDTYRISAVEQLKTYAEILNAPIEVAYDTKDVSKAITRLENRDILFIDTAGRSHKDKTQMMELDEILKEIKEKRIFLTIAANGNIEDIKNLIIKYSFLEDFDIIITKLDETDRLGIILDIIAYCQKSPAFLTYGQNVPDDIEKFNFNKFLNELFMESSYDRI